MWSDMVEACKERFGPLWLPTQTSKIQPPSWLFPPSLPLLFHPFFFFFFFTSPSQHRPVQLSPLSLCLFGHFACQRSCGIVSWQFRTGVFIGSGMCVFFSLMLCLSLFCVPLTRSISCHCDDHPLSAGVTAVRWWEGTGLPLYLSQSLHCWVTLLRVKANQGYPPSDNKNHLVEAKCGF